MLIYKICKNIIVISSKIYYNVYLKSILKLNNLFIYNTFNYINIFLYYLLILSFFQLLTIYH